MSENNNPYVLENNISNLNVLNFIYICPYCTTSLLRKDTIEVCNMGIKATVCKNNIECQNKFFKYDKLKDEKNKAIYEAGIKKHQGSNDKTYKDGIKYQKRQQGSNDKAGIRCQEDNKIWNRIKRLLNNISARLNT